MAEGKITDTLVQQTDQTQLDLYNSDYDELKDNKALSEITNVIGEFPEAVTIDGQEYTTTQYRLMPEADWGITPNGVANLIDKGCIRVGLWSTSSQSFFGDDEHAGYVRNKTNTYGPAKGKASAKLEDGYGIAQFNVSYKLENNDSVIKYKVPGSSFTELTKDSIGEKAHQVLVTFLSQASQKDSSADVRSENGIVLHSMYDAKISKYYAAMQDLKAGSFDTDGLQISQYFAAAQGSSLQNVMLTLIVLGYFKEATEVDFDSFTVKFADQKGYGDAIRQMFRASEARHDFKGPATNAAESVAFYFHDGAKVNKRDGDEVYIRPCWAYGAYRMTTGKEATDVEAEVLIHFLETEGEIYKTATAAFDIGPRIAPEDVDDETGTEVTGERIRVPMNYIRTWPEEVSRMAEANIPAYYFRYVVPVQKEDGTTTFIEITAEEGTKGRVPLIQNYNDLNEVDLGNYKRISPEAWQNMVGPVLDTGHTLRAIPLPSLDNPYSDANYYFAPTADYVFLTQTKANEVTPIFRIPLCNERVTTSAQGRAKKEGVTDAEISDTFPAFLTQDMMLALHGNSFPLASSNGSMHAASLEGDDPMQLMYDPVTGLVEPSFNYQWSADAIELTEWMKIARRELTGKYGYPADFTSMKHKELWLPRVNEDGEWRYLIKHNEVLYADAEAWKDETPNYDGKGNDDYIMFNNIPLSRRQAAYLYVVLELLMANQGSRYMDSTERAEKNLALSGEVTDSRALKTTAITLGGFFLINLIGTFISVWQQRKIMADQLILSGAKGKTSEEFLAEYTRDFRERALERYNNDTGTLGRSALMEDLFNTIGKNPGSGNSAALLGPAGTGKTFLMEYFGELLNLRQIPIATLVADIQRLEAELAIAPASEKLWVEEELAAAKRRLEGAKLSRLIPERYKNARLLELNLNKLIANTQYRGQAESRGENLMDAAQGNLGKNQKGIGAMAKRALGWYTRQKFQLWISAQVAWSKATGRPLILFIDEAHMLNTKGGGEGGFDLRQVLKPYLARGELTLIIATTRGESKQIFDGDPAFESRFTPLDVEELPREQVYPIMETRFIKALRYVHDTDIYLSTVVPNIDDIRYDPNDPASRELYRSMYDAAPLYNPGGRPRSTDKLVYEFVSDLALKTKKRWLAEHPELYITMDRLEAEYDAWVAQQKNRYLGIEGRRPGDSFFSWISVRGVGRYIKGHWVTAARGRFYTPDEGWMSWAGAKEAIYSLKPNQTARIQQEIIAERERFFAHQREEWLKAVRQAYGMGPHENPEMLITRDVINNYLIERVPPVIKATQDEIEDIIKSWSKYGITPDEFAFDKDAFRQLRSSDFHSEVSRYNDVLAAIQEIDKYLRETKGAGLGEVASGDSLSTKREVLIQFCRENLLSGEMNMTQVSFLIKQLRGMTPAQQAQLIAQLQSEQALRQAHAEAQIQLQAWISEVESLFENLPISARDKEILLQRLKEAAQRGIQRTETPEQGVRIQLEPLWAYNQRKEALIQAIRQAFVLYDADMASGDDVRQAQGIDRLVRSLHDITSRHAFDPQRLAADPNANTRAQYARLPGVEPGTIDTAPDLEKLNDVVKDAVESATPTDPLYELKREIAELRRLTQELADLQSFIGREARARGLDLTFTNHNQVRGALVERMVNELILTRIAEMEAGSTDRKSVADIIEPLITAEGTITDPLDIERLRHYAQEVDRFMTNDVISPRRAQSVEPPKLDPLPVPTPEAIPSELTPESLRQRGFSEHQATALLEFLQSTDPDLKPFIEQTRPLIESARPQNAARTAQQVSSTLNLLSDTPLLRDRIGSQIKTWARDLVAPSAGSGGSGGTALGVVAVPLGDIAARGVHDGSFDLSSLGDGSPESLALFAALIAAGLLSRKGPGEGATAADFQAASDAVRAEITTALGLATRMTVEADREGKPLDPNAIKEAYRADYEARHPGHTPPDVVTNYLNLYIRRNTSGATWLEALEIRKKLRYFTMESSNLDARPGETTLERSSRVQNDYYERIQIEAPELLSMGPDNLQLLSELMMVVEQASDPKLLEGLDPKMAELKLNSYREALLSARNAQVGTETGMIDEALRQTEQRAQEYEATHEAEIKASGRKNGLNLIKEPPTGAMETLFANLKGEHGQAMVGMGLFMVAESILATMKEPNFTFFEAICSFGEHFLTSGGHMAAFMGMDKLFSSGIAVTTKWGFYYLLPKRLGGPQVFLNPKIYRGLVASNVNALSSTLGGGLGPAAIAMDYIQYHYLQPEQYAQLQAYANSGIPSLEVIEDHERHTWLVKSILISWGAMGTGMAIGGATYGALVGTSLGPAGTIIGGAVGLGAGIGAAAVGTVIFDWWDPFEKEEQLKDAIQSYVSQAGSKTNFRIRETGNDEWIQDAKNSVTNKNEVSYKLAALLLSTRLSSIQAFRDMITSLSQEGDPKKAIYLRQLEAVANMTYVEALDYLNIRNIEIEFPDFTVKNLLGLLLTGAKFPEGVKSLKLNRVFAIEPIEGGSWAFHRINIHVDGGSHPGDYKDELAVEILEPDAMAYQQTLMRYQHKKGDDAERGYLDLRLDATNQDNIQQLTEFFAEQKAEGHPITVDYDGMTRLLFDERAASNPRTIMRDLIAIYGPPEGDERWLSADFATNKGQEILWSLDGPKRRKIIKHMVDRINETRLAFPLFEDLTDEYIVEHYNEAVYEFMCELYPDPHMRDILHIPDTISSVNDLPLGRDIMDNIKQCYTTYAKLHPPKELKPELSITTLLLLGQLSKQRTIYEEEPYDANQEAADLYDLFHSGRSDHASRLEQTLNHVFDPSYLDDQAQYTVLFALRELLNRNTKLKTHIETEHGLDLDSLFDTIEEASIAGNAASLPPILTDGPNRSIFPTTEDDWFFSYDESPESQPGTVREQIACLLGAMITANDELGETVTRFYRNRRYDLDVAQSALQEVRDLGYNGYVRYLEHEFKGIPEQASELTANDTSLPRLPGETDAAYYKRWMDTWTERLALKIFYCHYVAPNRTQERRYGHSLDSAIRIECTEYLNRFVPTEVSPHLIDELFIKAHQKAATMNLVEFDRIRALDHIRVVPEITEDFGQFNYEFIQRNWDVYKQNFEAAYKDPNRTTHTDKTEGADGAITQRLLQTMIDERSDAGTDSFDWLAEGKESLATVIHCLENAHVKIRPNDTIFIAHIQYVLWNMYQLDPKLKEHVINNVYSDEVDTSDMRTFYFTFEATPDTFEMLCALEIETALAYLKPLLAQREADIAQAHCMISWMEQMHDLNPDFVFDSFDNSLVPFPGFNQYHQIPTQSLEFINLYLPQISLICTQRGIDPETEPMEFDAVVYETITGEPGPHYSLTTEVRDFLIDISLYMINDKEKLFQYMEEQVSQQMALEADRRMIDPSEDSDEFDQLVDEILYASMPGIQASEEQKQQYRIQVANLLAKHPTTLFGNPDEGIAPAQIFITAPVFEAYDLVFAQERISTDIAIQTERRETAALQTTWMDQIQDLNDQFIFDPSYDNTITENGFYDSHQIPEFASHFIDLYAPQISLLCIERGINPETNAREFEALVYETVTGEPGPQYSMIPEVRDVLIDLCLPFITDKKSLLRNIEDKIAQYLAVESLKRGIDPKYNTGEFDALVDDVLYATMPGIQASAETKESFRHEAEYYHYIFSETFHDLANIQILITPAIFEAYDLILAQDRDAILAEPEPHEYEAPQNQATTVSQAQPEPPAQPEVDPYCEAIDQIAELNSDYEVDWRLDEQNQISDFVMLYAPQVAMMAFDYNMDARTDPAEFESLIFEVITGKDYDGTMLTPELLEQFTVEIRRFLEEPGNSAIMDHLDSQVAQLIAKSALECGIDPYTDPESMLPLIDEIITGASDTYMPVSDDLKRYLIEISVPYIMDPDLVLGNETKNLHPLQIFMSEPVLAAYENYYMGT